MRRRSHARRALDEPNGSNPMDFQRKSLSFRKRVYRFIKKYPNGYFLLKLGTPDRIRTYDPLFRRQML